MSRRGSLRCDQDWESGPHEAGNGPTDSAKAWREVGPEVDAWVFSRTGSGTESIPHSVHVFPKLHSAMV